MNEQNELMTIDGLEKLKRQLDDLESKLKSLRANKAEVIGVDGDMYHDNPLLYDMESQERVLMRRIVELRAKIAKAQIIEPAVKSDTVSVGSVVKVKFADCSIQTFHILGEADSDTRTGIISYKTPLAKALIGHKVGDNASFTVNNSCETVSILSID